MYYFFCKDIRSLLQKDYNIKGKDFMTKCFIRHEVFSLRSLESYGAQVAVNQKAILRLEIELTRLLGLKLNNEEVVIAFVKQEVVATVDKCGEQFLLTVRV